MDKDKKKIGVYIGELDEKIGGGFSFVAGILGALRCRVGDGYTWVCFYYGKKPSGIYNTMKWVRLKRGVFQYVLNNLCKYLIYWKIPVKKMKTGFEQICEKEKIQLLWYIRPDLLLNRYVPYIYTLWDIGHKVVPFFPEVGRGNEWEAREAQNQIMLHRASRVIIGNEVGKREILSHYHVEPDLIKVIPFAVTPFPEKSETIDKVEMLGRPFLVYPAQFWAHKNHYTALKTIVWLKEHKRKIDIVFTGKDYGNMEYIKRRSVELEIENQVHFLGFVKIEELVWLYKNALALTYFSAMGPNNLPPLEAMAVGCPVIISDLEGHREQFDDSAMYSSVFDAADWGNNIAKLIDSQSLRSDLVEKAKSMVKNMTYNKYLEDVLKVIDEFSIVRDLWD